MNKQAFNKKYYPIIEEIYKDLNDLKLLYPTVVKLSEAKSLELLINGKKHAIDRSSTIIGNSLIVKIDDDNILTTDKEFEEFVSYALNDLIENVEYKEELVEFMKEVVINTLKEDGYLIEILTRDKHIRIHPRSAVTKYIGTDKLEIEAINTKEVVAHLLGGFRRRVLNTNKGWPVSYQHYLELKNNGDIIESDLEDRLEELSKIELDDINFCNLERMYNTITEFTVLEKEDFNNMSTVEIIKIVSDLNMLKMVYERYQKDEDIFLCLEKHIPLYFKVNVTVR